MPSQLSGSECNVGLILYSEQNSLIRFCVLPTINVCISNKYFLEVRNTASGIIFDLLYQNANHIVSRIASIFLIIRIFDVTGCSSMPFTNSSLRDKFQYMVWISREATWSVRRHCSCPQS